jgi:hypothetical protein
VIYLFISLIESLHIGNINQNITLDSINLYSYYLSTKNKIKKEKLHSELYATLAWCVWKVGDCLRLPELCEKEIVEVGRNSVGKKWAAGVWNQSRLVCLMQERKEENI